MLEIDKNGNLSIIDQDIKAVFYQKEDRELKIRRELINDIKELQMLNEQMRVENGYLKEFIRHHIINGDEILQSMELYNAESMDIHDTLAYVVHKNVEQEKSEISMRLENKQVEKKQMNREENYGIRPRI